jgi:NAD-dependent deacetylase
MTDQAGSKWLQDERLVKVLQGASRVAVLTGAGISAESGIPTFRGDQGLWKRFRPEELASFDAFMANPTLVWEWYHFRRDIVRNAEPNPGHLALARWESHTPEFSLITQNVDGLHERAGSTNIIELHGNIMRDRCLDCGLMQQGTEHEDVEELPHCPCGGRLRPDVVWFGEMLPEGAIETAFLRAAECELCLSVGTSAVVTPAANVPMVALRNGATLVEVNPEPTPLSHHAHFTLFGSAGDVLPALVEAATC